VTYPAESPVVAVRIDMIGEHYQIDMCRADSEMSVVHGATISGGLRHPGEVFIHLLAHGVPMDDAARCVEEVEPGFDAALELTRRSETDMVAWRLADHLRREELKARYRHERGL
jgi:hypothetical protein